MRQIILAAAILAAAAGAASAQTKNKPTTGPFGTEWARPTGETGGYIYNDPRLQERRGSASQRERAATGCPIGRTYVPASGRCQ
jgi:hypothetical protein